MNEAGNQDPSGPLAVTPDLGPLQIGSAHIPPGQRERVELTVSRLASGHWLSLPIEVINGKGRGPTVWLSGAIHGDEIEGVEIIRQVLLDIDPETLNGRIIAVPIVNIFGFVAETRYMPDRRDLNRSFPGRKNGSLAARLAHLFMSEVVSRCDYGIDLHCGSDDRTNLPQTRANLDDPATRRLAEAFRAPVMIHNKGVKGSLRMSAGKVGVPVTLFEGGEPRRFTEPVTRAGVLGVRGVLQELGMTDGPPDKRPPSVEVKKTTWLRAGRSGILRLAVALGDPVRRGQKLGVIADPCGDASGEVHVKAKHAGIVIGYTLNPLVNWGDGVIHVAEV